MAAMPRVMGFRQFIGSVGAGPSSLAAWVRKPNRTEPGGRRGCCGGDPRRLRVCRRGSAAVDQPADRGDLARHHRRCDADRRKWDKVKVAWATRGAVAATVIAPLLTTVNAADVYVDAETILGLEAAAASAGLRPIEGGRLTLRPFPSVTARLLATRMDGLMVAPWPRVFADVRTIGVRGEEAAEHLGEVMHGR